MNDSNLTSRRQWYAVDSAAIRRIVRDRTWRFIFLVLAFIVQNAAYGQEPEVHWEVATWAPWNPTSGYATQDQTGEDWAYDVELSYSGSLPDGYIYSGYTSFPGHQFTEGTWDTWQCSNLTTGCAVPKLFKTDLDGNLLWYEHYTQNEGELTAVIQTSDGGFLAVGRSREWDDRLTYYGDASTVTDLGFACDPACQSTLPRNVYAVKTDANGNVVWEKLYGLEDDPVNNLNLLNGFPEAWDVVEMAGTPVKYRIVGQVLDPGDTARDDDGDYVTKAFMLEINASGVRQWIKTYGETGKASISRGLARDGNSYAMVVNQFGGPEYLKSSAEADIWMYRVGNGANPSASTTQLTSSSSEHDFGYDVVYNTSGDILLAGVIDCTWPGGCFRNAGARGVGTARVYRIDSGGTVLANTGNTLGTVRAFDLWTSLTATSDGRSILVSTKQTTPGTSFEDTDALLRSSIAPQTMQYGR